MLGIRDLITITACLKYPSAPPILTGSIILICFTKRDHCVDGGVCALVCVQERECARKRDRARELDGERERGSSLDNKANINNKKLC